MSLKSGCGALSQKTAICNLPLGIPPPPFLFILPLTRLFCNRRRSPLPGIDVLLNKWSRFGRGAENARRSPSAGAGACCNLGGGFKDRQSSFGIQARRSHVNDYPQDYRGSNTQILRPCFENAPFWSAQEDQSLDIKAGAAASFWLSEAEGADMISSAALIRSCLRSLSF